MADSCKLSCPETALAAADGCNFHKIFWEISEGSSSSLYQIIGKQPLQNALTDQLLALKTSKLTIEPHGQTYIKWFSLAALQMAWFMTGSWILSKPYALSLYSVLINPVCPLWQS